MTKLFVGNLSFEVTAADLRLTFEPHGRVSAVHIVLDGPSGRSRGFGFIEMAQESQATAAIAALEGAVVKGRTITVSRAHAKAHGGAREKPSQGWAVVGDARHRW